MYAVLPVVAAALFGIASGAPFTPNGGLSTNSSSPIYQPLSDFDYQSLNLALYQEYIELDLFFYALAKFSAQDFYDAGLSDADIYLIEFMGNQEIGHATLVSNIVGPENATQQCNYTYPFETVSEFIDFSQKITRAGESGTYGFLEHLDSRDAAQLLLQSITVEARQQMIFRQFEGLFPMPFWFNPSVTQAMQWSILAPYITSCPGTANRVEFQTFPYLNVSNQPNVTGMFSPAISANHTALTSPGETFYLSWESPGRAVGPDNAYITNTTAGEPAFVAWVSQVNTTYTPLQNISKNTGSTYIPGGEIYGNGTFSTVNGTVFVLITDQDLFVTPANFSLINEHVVAGPALVISG